MRWERGTPSTLAERRTPEERQAAGRTPGRGRTPEEPCTPAGQGRRQGSSPGPLRAQVREPRRRQPTARRKTTEKNVGI